MSEKPPQGLSSEEPASLLPSIGVPQSVLFYIALGAISTARKLLMKAIAVGCPLDEENCVDFTDIQPGTELNPVTERGGFTFTALDKKPLRIIGWGVPSGKSKLQIRPDGVEVRLPYPTERVTMRGAQYTGHPLVLQAYNNGDLLDEATAPPVEDVLHTLVAEGTEITRVVLKGGGGEGMLFTLCIPRQEPATESRPARDDTEGP